MPESMYNYSMEWFDKSDSLTGNFQAALLETEPIDVCLVSAYMCGA